MWKEHFTPILVYVQKIKGIHGISNGLDRLEGSSSRIGNNPIRNVTHDT